MPNYLILHYSPVTIFLQLVAVTEFADGELFQILEDDKTLPLSKVFFCVSASFYALNIIFALSFKITQLVRKIIRAHY